MTSFAEKVLLQRPELMYLVTGTDKGQPAWYYVRVHKPKLDAFKRALGDHQIHLEEYGEILYSGFGANPPVDLKQKIEKLFGGK